MASTTTVEDLIASARIRHWAFADVAVGDGAALLYVNQRIRHHIASQGAQLEGFLSKSVQYAIPLVGPLVAIVNGVPTLTDGDGLAFHITATPFATYQNGYRATLVGGVPTIDPTSPVIAADPFGQQFADSTIGPFIDPLEIPLARDPFGTVNGGTPGFPLPSDLVRLIGVSLVYNNLPTLIPCRLLAQADRLLALPGRDPTLFVSGNRLIPLYQQPTFPSADRWANVAGIQITYIPLPLVRQLTETVVLPAVLCGALIADLASFFAGQSKHLAAADRSTFAKAADTAAADMKEEALGMLNDSELETVIYRG